MKTKGFTLVELLVVIAILAILATVSVVGYTSYIENANETVAKDTLIKIRDYAISYDIASGDKNGEISETEAKAAIEHVLGTGILTAQGTPVQISGTIVTYTKGTVTAQWNLEDGTVTKVTSGQ